MGKMLESLGRNEHAVLTYRKLYQNAPAAVEGMDALYFSARLLESRLHRRTEAIDAYRKLSTVRPYTPHAVEAAFRLGVLLEQQERYGEAYNAFRMVDEFRERFESNPGYLFRSRVRYSRFLRWPHALKLYREAIVRMVSLYQRITVQTQERPPVPRGTFILNVENPTISEPMGRSQPLFHSRKKFQYWREKFYAVIVPAGYVASGVDLSVKGRLLLRQPHHSFTIRVLEFPLPRSFSRKWLGAIYGQTENVTTLKKAISFHGEHRKILTIQLIESNAQIESWAVHVRIRPEQELERAKETLPIQKNGKFWEGQLAGRVPLPRRNFSGSMRPSIESFYGPQKDLALAADRRGSVYLVTVEGELDSEPTDLWWSRSQDGHGWSELTRLPVNSASEDYDPRLILAEDGTMWLFWISNRRGLGWELWASSLHRNQTWSPPHRIPLEQFIDTATKTSAKESNGQRGGLASIVRVATGRIKSFVRQKLFGDVPGVDNQSRTISEMIEYDVLQDRRGRWVAVFYSRANSEMVFIRSPDGLDWKILSRVSLDEPLHGPSLVEDRQGILRMAALGTWRELHLWSSKDGLKWDPKKFSNPSSYPASVVGRRTRMFALPAGQLMLLISDTVFGLQYARFFPQMEKPRFDLVSKALLEPFAAAALPKGGYLVALKQDDEILLRSHREFNSTGTDIEKDQWSWPIYVEREEDAHRNVWNRITARARVIIPDVTSVGLEPSGRVWWGIESGIMAKKGDEFFATDVSQGFFYHYVTDIKGCGGSIVWFTSNQLDRPVVGYTDPRERGVLSAFSPEFKTHAIPNASGAVTAIQCGHQAGQVYIGTSRGSVVGLNHKEIIFHHALESAPYVTALAVDRNTGTLWVGTRQKGLYRLQGKSQQHFDQVSGLPLNEVTALTVDARGALWVGLNGNGLLQYDGKHWVSFTPENSLLSYHSIGKLESDPTGGVWFIAHEETLSRGLGHFDGRTEQLYNPPHRVLDKPSSLAVDQNGHVWVGTWFDGLYSLKPRQDQP